MRECKPFQCGSKGDTISQAVNVERLLSVSMCQCPNLGTWCIATLSSLKIHISSIQLRIIKLLQDLRSPRSGWCRQMGLKGRLAWVAGSSSIVGRRQPDDKFQGLTPWVSRFTQWWKTHQSAYVCWYSQPVLHNMTPFTSSSHIKRQDWSFPYMSTTCNHTTEALCILTYIKHITKSTDHWKRNVDMSA